MKRRIAILMAVAALVALAAVPMVYARGSRHHGRAAMHGGDASGMFLFAHGDRVRKALDLSDEQVDKLKAIATELRTQNEPYREQLRGGRQAIASALLANPNDLAAAQAQLDKQLSAERAAKLNALAAVSKAINVLTPEQRAKVANFLERRQARREQR